MSALLRDDQASDYEAQAATADYKARRARNKSDAKYWACEAARLRKLARGT